VLALSGPDLALYEFHSPAMNLRPLLRVPRRQLQRPQYAVWHLLARDSGFLRVARAGSMAFASRVRPAAAFWDVSTWIWPTYNVFFPAIARDVLQYRVNRQAAAAANALQNHVRYLPGRGGCALLDGCVGLLPCPV
jgi:hypothetical protein